MTSPTVPSSRLWAATGVDDALGRTLEDLPRWLGRVMEMQENVKAFEALGNDTQDDGPKILNAIAKAGYGGTVHFPAGAYKTSVPLVPMTGQRWTMAGRRDYDLDSGGVTIHYTGTGAAVDVSGVNSFSMGDCTIHCTGSGSPIGIKMEDGGGQNSNNEFGRIVLNGPGVGSGTAVKMFGQLTCVCHNKFKTLYIRNWNEGIRCSGFANANVFENSVIVSCTSGIVVAKVGTDTKGGDDNEFNRVEIDGSTTNGITIADDANRNVFFKVVEDGVTTVGVSIAATCDDNAFAFCVLSPTVVDNGTNTAFFHCTGAGVGANNAHLVFGDVNLYRQAANILATDDKLHVVGELELDGAFNHDGTTFGIYGVTPAARPAARTITNLTTDRALDCDSTSTAELADVLGTLIEDLKLLGILQ